VAHQNQAQAFRGAIARFCKYTGCKLNVKIFSDFLILFIDSHRRERYIALKNFVHTKKEFSMPVIFSRACEYALRALLEMAHHPEQESWTVQELATRTDTPAPFLAKTFQLLVKGDILSSLKGRRGGFTFARQPNKLSIMEIVNLIDGPMLTQNCALGLSTCSDTNPCPFHPYWKDIRNSITRALQQQTLLRLAQIKHIRVRHAPEKN
jgi:Rrf2 family protein